MLLFLGRLFAGLVFALLGCAIAFGFELLTLYLLSELLHANIHPRGIGWAIGPIVISIGAFKLGYSFDPGELWRRMTARIEARAAIALAAGWALVLTAYFWLTDPFGLYIDEREALMIFQMYTIPLIMIAICYGLFRWVKRSN